MPAWFIAFAIAGLVFAVVGNALWFVMLRGWCAPEARASEVLPTGDEPKVVLAGSRTNPIAPTLGRSAVGSTLEVYQDRLVIHPKFRTGAPWTFDRTAICETRVQWAPGGSVVLLLDIRGRRRAIAFVPHPVAATRRSLADGGWLGRRVS